MTTAKSVRSWLFAALFVIVSVLHAERAVADDTFTPVLLTEELMERYVAALPEIVALKADYPGTTDDDVIAFWTGMVDIAKRHGFEDYGQFAELSATVAVLMTGIDVQTKTFAEPKKVAERQIVDLEQIISDLGEDILAGRRGDDIEAELEELLPLMEALKEMKEGLDVLPEQTDPDSIELIRKYFGKIIRIANPPQAEQ